MKILSLKDFKDRVNSLVDLRREIIIKELEESNRFFDKKSLKEFLSKKGIKISDKDLEYLRENNCIKFGARKFFYGNLKVLKDLKEKIERGDFSFFNSEQVTKMFPKRFLVKKFLDSVNEVFTVKELSLRLKNLFKSYNCDKFIPSGYCLKFKKSLIIGNPKVLKQFLFFLKKYK